MADLEINNPSNSFYAQGVSTYFKKQKEEGWKEFKPQKPRKLKLKQPDPYGKKKFRLMPREPDILSLVPRPQKIAECLQNATEWFYHAGFGQIVIKISDAPDMHITDPLMMY